MVRSALSISPSQEDCLRSIFITKQQKQVVRVKDLAKSLKVRAPSVIEILKRLKEKNLVVQEHYGYIELTQEGLNKAKEIYERHIILKKFFHQVLRIDEKVAEEDVCKIEHYLSKKSLEMMYKFVNFIEIYPQGMAECLNNFYYFAKHEERSSEFFENSVKSLERNPQNKIVKLSELKVGDKAKILKITDTGILKTRLLGLGFVRGEIVKIEKIAPLGSPIDVLIKNTHISLRKEEAEKVIGEVL